jgi:DNA-binding protein YbaB
MSFLDDLKNLHNLKQKAEEMQSALANEKVTGKSKDEAFLIVMNGNQEVLAVTVPENGYDKNQIETGIKEAFFDARRKIENIIKSKINLIG